MCVCQSEGGHSDRKLIYSGRSKYGACTKYSTRPNRRQYQSKKLHFQKKNFQKIKNGKFSSRSWTKFRIFYLNSRKYSFPQKAVFFCRIFACDIFLRRRIFVDFKTKFSKVSRSPSYIPISRCCYGEHFLRKVISKPRLSSERWSTRAQSIGPFGFTAKNTLRIKIQCWFFSLEVHECISFWNIKKNC
jgi:hypothetical protein